MNSAAPLGAVFHNLSSGLRALALRSAARPRLALAVVLAAAALAAGFAATHLRVNTDSSDMISSRLPYRQREIALEAAYPSLTDQMIVIVEAPNADAADAFSQRLVDAINARSDSLSQPFAPAIDPFFVHNGLLLMDDADLDTTLSRISRAGPLLSALAAKPTLDTYFTALAQGVRDADKMEGGEEALTYALRETTGVIDARLAGAPQPVGWSELFSGEPAGGHVTRLVSARPVLNFSSLQPAKEALAALQAAIDEARAAPGLEHIDAEITGEPALRGQELSSVTQGLALSFVISLLSVSFILWLAFGRVVQALLSVVVVICALCWAAAFAALAYPALNLVSMAFAALLTGLGADYAIHVLLRANEARQHGADEAAAMDETVSELAGPLALCATTTAIGFIAFIATDFVGLAQLGLIGAVGVFGALLAAIVVAPAGLALLRPSVRIHPVGESVLTPIRARFARYWPPARWGVLGLACLSVLAIPFARFETDPMALRDVSSPSVVAFEKLFDEDDTRPYRASVVAPDLASADAIAERARQLPSVASAVTLSQFAPPEAFDRFFFVDSVAIGLLPLLQEPQAPAQTGDGLDALRQALAEHARTGGAELAAALARLKTASDADPDVMPALESDVFRYWPMQLDRLKALLQPDPDLSLDAVPPAIRENFIAADGRARVEITPRADLRNDQARAAFVDEVSAAIPEATGGPVTIERSGAVVSKAMAIATIGALAAITLLVFAVWRDWRRALSVLAPLLAAAVLTVGLTVILGVPFNYANVIALPMLLGAGVDSAIHVNTRAKAVGDSSAMFAASTPRAVVFSALTTIASFGSLMVSAHRGVASIGALLVIALTSTIVCTLALQPLADRLMGRREHDTIS